MAAIMQQLQAWVSASGILADKMAVIMIIALFGLMVVGLVLGQNWPSCWAAPVSSSAGWLGAAPALPSP